MAISSWTLEEVKAGHIRPFYGLRANIPSGWIECDGANGTPDLRGTYPKGAGAGQEANVTGGDLTHSHTDHTGVINHTHPVTDPGHNHLTQRYPTATGSSSGFTMDTSMSGTLADNTLPVKANTTGITTQNPAGGVSALTHNSPNHEPPYKTCIWIMKT